MQGKGEGISLTPHYHFHPPQRHLDINWEVAAARGLETETFGFQARVANY